MDTVDEMDEIIREFLVESSENLDQLDGDLVALEQDPTNQELLRGIFRCIHTIKGTCGFLGFEHLEGVTHAGENLLSEMREGRVCLDQSIASALLTMVDAVRAMLTTVEAKRTDGTDPYTPLVGLLQALAAGEAAPVEAAPVAAPPASAPIPEDHPYLLNPITPLSTPAAEPAPPEPVAAPPPVVPQPVERRAPVAQAESNKPVVAPVAASASIRVDVNHLDRLMNLVGELVLARNQLLQYSGKLGDQAFHSTAQQLNHITTELQEGVMKTRMQPIRSVWSKFPRVVRDLAVACKKRVRVEMHGEDTELDKSLLEAIKDPLTHVVRNSVDHGIEMPETRSSAGKSVEGVLTLRAYHEGGQVNIEIGDDGGGIDVDRVAAKAIEKGLITRDEVAAMSKKELLNLIFRPGFSTAEAVSHLSGRGVGMDVVRTNIENIGGTVDIQSERGRGTTLKIKIPLTLAIIPALMIKASGHTFALPQVSLLELIRLEGAAASDAIEFVHGVPLFRLRGRILPLIDLNQQLEFAGHEPLRPLPGTARPALAPDRSVSIIVLQADERPFGLIVDEICDTEEIVVKPLSKSLKAIGTYSGATILGDGRVALILDVVRVAQRAGVAVGQHASAFHMGTDEDDLLGERQTVLLFLVGASQYAIPLAWVSRLEEFEEERVEHAGGTEVVQYRNGILPLIRLADVLGEQSQRVAGDPLKVLVHLHRGQPVGLVVDDILDIIEDHFDLHRRVDGSNQSVLGSTVIQGRVTDVIDVSAVVGGTAVFLEGNSARSWT